MAVNQDQIFQQQRSDTFARVIALIETRITATPSALLLNPNDVSLDSAHHSATRECWSLLLKGIKHLQNGAPGSKPGMLAEALTRASLRSSGLAAALGVKPPHFEQMYFAVDYTTGHEAALFLCRRLLENAENDLHKSKRLINQRMRAGTPDDAIDADISRQDIEALRRQVGLSFNVLANTYATVCHDFGDMLNTVQPPTAKPSQGPKP